MKIRVTLPLWAASTVIVGVVMMLAEGRMQQREARPVLVPGELSATRSHPRPSQLDRQSWTHRNIYLRHYHQEEPDTSVIYNYWARRAGRRYHSSGPSSEGSLYTERVASARHDSREPRPRRVHTTYSAAGNAASSDSLPLANSRTSTGERSTSRLHQMNSPGSTDNRRQYAHTQGSHETRVQSIPREDVPQRPLPDRRVSNRYRAPSIYNNSRESFRPSRPLEGRPHSRDRLQDTHQGPISRANLSMAANVTRDFPEGLTGPGNQELQLLGRPDLCCGSRVPLDPRAVVATGGFQRVASAGSIKVVEVPAQDIFPPNDVRDLIATPVDTNTLSLTWTAPGEDLDSGTASGYIVRLSEEQRNLQESHFDSAPEETLLETADSLVAAGVYQTAGTQVEVEVPVGRRLERGHLYYVALKALDNDGLSSGVSNVAQFSIPEFLAEGTAVRPHYHPAAEHNVKDPRLEDPLSASRSRETAQGREDITQLPERTHITPSPRHADPVSEVAEGHNGWDSEDSEAVESDGPRKQEKRNGKKNRKKKKNKSKRRRKEGRRNGRRRGSERQGEGSDTSTHEPDMCEPSEQEQLESVSLCDARRSLALAITYFTQNNDLQYLDYLSAALLTLTQKMQPSWRAESRVRRSGGGQREGRRTKLSQNL
ncbi:uncharacterized protein LOC127000230 isoform X1 [Eriocheir sinensis]|uniref:uncharacterized protein LOC127000230 isoform X1 n=1 Tax=Eriocheir sinensis TaxID=95602 RepID=UPI0021CA95B4|nr:uncharacterized protein LOC127000230 isoform X1 [Eriocheir sinensis]